jgi:hypothetical protein
MQKQLSVIAVGVAVGLLGLGLFVGNAMTQNGRCDQLSQNYRALVDKPVTGQIGVLQAQATYEHACGTAATAAAADTAVKQAQDAVVAQQQAAQQAAAKQQADSAAAAQQAQKAAADAAAKKQADAQAEAQRVADAKAKADQQAADQAAQKQAEADAIQAKADAPGPDGRPMGLDATRSKCEEMIFEAGLSYAKPKLGAMQAEYAQAGCPGLSGFQPTLG